MQYGPDLVPIMEHAKVQTREQHIMYTEITLDIIAGPLLHKFVNCKAILLPFAINPEMKVRGMSN
jgi:hypothetical protein